MNEQPLRATVRKRNLRAKRTSDQLENSRARDRENKRLKRSAETAEQREVRLRKNRERYHKRKEDRVLININEHLNRREDESRIQDDEECHLSEADRKLLQIFRSKVDKLTITTVLCVTNDSVYRTCRRSLLSYM